MADTPNTEGTINSNVMIDFEQSIKSAQEFGAAVGEVAAKMNDISNVKLNVSKMLSTELAKWNESSAMTNQIDMKSFVGKIEKAIGRTILGRDIEILGVGEGAIEVTLSAKQVQKVKSDIKKAYAEAVDKSIVKFKTPKIVIKDTDVTQIEQAFEQKLKEGLTQKLEFAFDESGVKPLTLRIDNRHLKKVIDTFDAKLLEMLSDPELFAIDEKSMPKSQASEKIKQALATIDTSFKDLDENLNIEVAELKKLPNMSESLNKFRGNLRQLMKEMLEVNKDLSKSPIEDARATFAVVREAISHLQQGIAKSATDFITQINNEIAMAPVSTVEAAEYVSAARRIDVVINEFVKGRINNSINEMLGSMGVGMESINGKNIFVPSLQALQKAISKATKQAVENISKENLDLDIAPINQAFQEWSTFMEAKMGDSIKDSLAQITVGMLTADAKVTETLQAKVAQLVEGIELDKKKADKITISSTEIKERIVPQIKEMVLDLTKNITITEAGEKISIPDSALSELRAALQKMVIEEVSVAQKAINKKIAAEGKEGKTEIESLANAQVETLRSELVGQIRLMITSLLSGIQLILPENLGVKIDEKILEGHILPVLQEQINSMMQNLVITPTGTGVLTIPIENMEALNTALSRSLSTYLNSMTEINTTLDASQFAGISERVKSELEKFNASIGNYMNNVVGVMSAEMLAATPPAGAVVTRPAEHPAAVAQHTVAEEGFDSKSAQFLQTQMETIDKELQNSMVMSIAGRKDEIVAQLKSKMEADKGFNINAAQSELAASMVQPLTEWIGRVGKYVRYLSQDLQSPKLVDVDSEIVKHAQKQLKLINNQLEKFEDATVSEVNKGLGSQSLDGMAQTYSAMLRRIGTGIYEEVNSRLTSINEKISVAMKTEVPAATIPIEKVEAVKTSMAGMFNQAMTVLDDFPVQEIISVVNSGVNELFNALVVKIKTAMTACVEGMASINVSELGTDEAAQFQAIVTENFNRFMNEYIMAAKQALSVLTVTGDMVKGLENQLNKAVKKGEAGEVNFDLNMAVNEAIAKVEKATMQSVKDTVPEVRPLVIKTETLAKAIEKAVAKVIKEVKVNIPPIEVAYEIEGLKDLKTTPVKVDMVGVKASIDTYVTQYIKSIAGMLFTETAPKVMAEGFGKAQMSNLVAALKPLDAVVEDYTKALVAGAQSADYRKSISFKTSKIVPEVVQELAKDKGMTTSQFRQENKSISGIENLQTIMKENINFILRQFHEAIQDQTLLALKDYKTAIAEVKIEPDTTAVYDMRQKLINLQQEIVRKVRQILDEQFKSMTAEIRALKVAPVTFTPTVPTNTKAAISGTTTTPSTVVPTVSTPSGAKVGGGVTSPRVTNPGGDTHSFMGSIINTIRYITAGTLFMIPYTLANEAMTSATEFDYQLMKAQQNFLMKDQTMREAAYTEVQRKSERASKTDEQIWKEAYANFNSDEERNAYVEKAKADRAKWAGEGYSIDAFNNSATREGMVANEAKRLQYMTREGMVRPLQDTALMYGLTQQEMGQAWQVASRRLDNPYEAFNLARATGKLYAYEKEGSPEEIAVGLEAIASQFQLSGDDMGRVSNMLIKTAAMSQVTVKELLEAEKRSGSVFLQNMPGVDKDRALATSMGLSSLFVQATGRTGAEAGTFWRTVFMAPWKNPATMDYLEKMSKSRASNGETLNMLNPWAEETIVPGTENNLAPQKIKKQKDGLSMFLDVMTAATKMDDASAKELLVKVYPRWFQAGVLSVETAMEDLQRIKQKMNVEGKNGQDVTLNDLSKELINQIQNVTEKDIATMMVNAQDTWQYKKQKAQTMWQVASYEVLDTFKSDFDVLITDLTAWLRMIRDHAGTVSELLKGITKIAEFVGIKWLGGKVKDKLLTRGYEKNSGLLYQEAQLLGLKRNMLEGKFANAQQKKMELLAIQNAHGDKQNELAIATNERDELKGKIADVDARRPELEARRTELAGTYSNYLVVEKRTQDLQGQIAKLKEANAPGYASTIATKEAQLAKFEQAKNSLAPGYAEYLAINQTLNDRDEWTKQLAGKEKHVANLSKGEAVESQKVKAFASGVPNTDAILKDIAGVDAEMAVLQKRMGLLGMAYQDLGLKGVESINLLDAGIRTSSAVTVQYATEIKGLATAAGLSNKQLDGLIAEINGLTAAENRGKLTSKELDIEIRKLAADYAKLNMGANGLAGTRLVNTVMADSVANGGQGAKLASEGNFIGPALFAYGLGKATTGEKASGVLSNMWGGVKGFFGNLRTSPKAALASLGSGIVGGVTGLGSKVKNFLTGGEVLATGKTLAKSAGSGLLSKGAGLLSKGAGLLGTVGKFAKSNWIWAALSGAWDIGSDVLNAQALNQYEYKQNNASKLDELASSAANLKGMSWLNPMKYISGLGFGWDWLTHGVSRAMGGTAPSFGETWTAAKAMFTQDQGAIKDYLKAQYDTDNMRREALIQERVDEENYLKEHADEVRINGVYRKKGDVITAEDAQSVIQDMNTALQQALTKVNYTSQSGAAWYILHGQAENNPLVSNEQQTGLEGSIDQRNEKIKELQTYMDAIKDSVGDGYQYAESYKLFEAEQNQERINMLNDQMQLRKLQLAKASYISEVSDREKSMTQLQWGMKTNQLLAQGYAEDSPAVKAMQRASLQAQNKDLGSEINKLREQLADTNLYPPGSDDYQNLLLKITQLQSEQVENLAKIRELMKNSLPTFNLPSGVKPMTYYEAMTQNNTHKNVSIQSGDININIVMDKNMPTSNAEAMGSAMGKEVARQLRNTNATLAQNVKAGLGYSYNGYAGIGG